jgi:tetrahydromethanopterin S-methyltransferase subunit A
MLKKAWITAHVAGMSVLSLESQTVEPEYAQLSVDTRLFPDRPSVKHSQRHVCTVRLLDEDDLRMIRDAISAFLEQSSEQAFEDETASVPNR